VSLIDIAGSVIGVFITVLSLIFLTCFRQDVRDFLEDEELSGKDGKEFLAILEQMGTLVILVITVGLVSALLQLALATFLYKGARERDAGSCQLWWKIKVVLFLLGVLLVSGMILVSQHPGQLAVSSVIGFVYHAYALWVVQAYIDEIRFGRKLQEEEGNCQRDTCA